MVRSWWLQRLATPYHRLSKVALCWWGLNPQWPVQTELSSPVDSMPEPDPPHRHRHFPACECPRPLLSPALYNFLPGLCLTLMLAQVKLGLMTCVYSLSSGSQGGSVIKTRCCLWSQRLGTGLWARRWSASPLLHVPEESVFQNLQLDLRLWRAVCLSGGWDCQRHLACL